MLCYDKVVKLIHTNISFEYKKASASSSAHTMNLSLYVCAVISIGISSYAVVSLRIIYIYDVLSPISISVRWRRASLPRIVSSPRTENLK